jgi:uncharacterized protein (DUF1330 family)
MTVYAIAQLTIHDRARYQKYVAGFMQTLLPFKGRLLAADETPLVVEGHWERDKLVLIAFDNADAFHQWAESPAYKAISVDRTAATEGPVLMVHGLG